MRFPESAHFPRPAPPSRAEFFSCLGEIRHRQSARENAAKGKVMKKDGKSGLSAISSAPAGNFFHGG